MATPTLPSANSVVDFLKSQGKDSSFTARKKMFNDLGFSSRLGEFQGGSNQNMALLKELQRQQTADLNKSTSVPATTVKETVTATPAPSPSLSKVFDSVGIDFRTAQTTPSTLLKDVAPKTTTPPAPAAPAPATPVVQDTSTVKVAPTTPPATQAPKAQTPSEQVDITTKETVGLSASDIYPDIFGDTTPSEGDLLNKFLNSPEAANLFTDAKNKNLSTEAKAEALKQAAETKYEADRTALEDKLAANGLAFSGIRGSKVKALADDLAASSLGVDRDLASALLESDSKLRDAILKGVADLAKDASDGRKEAIQQLNAIGFAVVGNQLVPTLSARSGERAERSLQISEERLKLAEAAAARAAGGNKLTLSELRSMGLPPSLVGQSEQDIAYSFYSTTPPAWFVDKVNNEARQNLLPDVVQKLWDEESTKYQESVKEKTPTATVIGNVRALRDKDATEEEINDYIIFSGYDVDDPAFD